MLTEGLLNACIGLVVLGAMFVPLERSFAARPQRHLRAEFGLDLAFFLLQYLVMAWVLLWVNERLRVWAGPLGPVALSQQVHRLPLPAQVALSVVLGDLGLYWAHRLSHAVPLLWRFHAVHHSVESLDWLAAHREHPLDGIYSQIFLNLPACLLGVDLAAMMPVFVFRGLWAIFVHSNIRMPLGPLGLLFGDPVLHRWHHARVERCAHNFANLAPYLDVLFGTHHRPADESFALGIREERKPSMGHRLLAPFFGGGRP